MTDLKKTACPSVSLQEAHNAVLKLWQVTKDFGTDKISDDEMRTLWDKVHAIWEENPQNTYLEKLGYGLIDYYEAIRG